MNASEKQVWSSFSIDQIHLLLKYKIHYYEKAICLSEFIFHCPEFVFPIGYILQPIMYITSIKQPLDYYMDRLQANGMIHDYEKFLFEPDTASLTASYNPNNLIEQNIQSLILIQQNYITDTSEIITGWFENYSTEDYSRIAEIASLNPFENGPAVFIAQMLLDTVADYFEDEQEERLGIETIGSNWSLTPNPTEGLLYLNAPNFSGGISIQITNVLKQVVAKFDVNVDPFLSLQINCSSLQSGLYFIHAIDENGNQLFIQKFVKQ